MTEQKRGRGRPENNDNEVLTAILNNEDKRKEFVEAIENLVYHKRKIPGSKWALASVMSLSWQMA